MPKYTVAKPFPSGDGRTLQPGDSIDLTDRQAKYPLLGGKLERPALKKTTEKKGD